MFLSRHLWIFSYLHLGVIVPIFALSSNVVVRPVRTESDVNALADLRYDEFIGGEIPRDAFRMATAEIVEERKDGAVSFVAWLNDVAVGATEVSSIELQKAIPKGSTMLYATDLVVAREHRRKGIAGLLLAEMEKHCSKVKAESLLLHIKPDNEAARALYEKYGFRDADDSLLKRLDADILAANAGTKGQRLLYKSFGRMTTGGMGFKGTSSTEKKKQKKR